VALSLIIAYAVQIVMEIFVIPRFFFGSSVYVTKVFISTSLFFVFVPGFAIYKNNDMFNLLKTKIRKLKPSRCSNDVDVELRT